jgi:hypothetical protein
MAKKTGIKRPPTNDQQNTTQKTKDRSIGPQLEGGRGHRCLQIIGRNVVSFWMDSKNQDGCPGL